MVHVPKVPFEPADLERVARVLLAIATTPGRRLSPEPDDLPGSFDCWFDGGACSHDTDHTHFQLADGSEAWVSTSLAALRGGVRLPSGQVVQFEQSRREQPAEPPVLAAAQPDISVAENVDLGELCVLCGQKIEPGTTHAITPRGPAHMICP
jgi:hypothetical protein